MVLGELGSPEGFGCVHIEPPSPGKWTMLLHTSPDHSAGDGLARSVRMQARLHMLSASTFTRGILGSTVHVLIPEPESVSSLENGSLQI